MISETHDNDGVINLPDATSDYSLMTNHAIGNHSPTRVSPSGNFENCVQTIPNSSISCEKSALKPTQVVLEANNKVSVVKVG